jgi:hypothetical protein
MKIDEGNQRNHLHQSDMEKLMNLYHLTNSTEFKSAIDPNSPRFEHHLSKM